MFNPETDFIFPSRVVPQLGSLRGPVWQRLVERAEQEEEVEPEHLGFVLMMVGLNGCERCNADSFKAMRGCLACSKQTIERFPGSDEDLEESYASSIEQIVDYQASIGQISK